MRRMLVALLLGATIATALNHWLVCPIGGGPVVIVVHRVMPTSDGRIIEGEVVNTLDTATVVPAGGLWFMSPAGKNVFTGEAGEAHALPPRLPVAFTFTISADATLLYVTTSNNDLAVVPVPAMCLLRGVR